MKSILELSIGQLLWSSAGVIVLLSVFVEITPIKINPLSAIAKWFGKKANGDIRESVEHLRTEVQGIKEDISRQQAELCRARILQFGDELRVGARHSHDHFQQILADISTYEHYCNQHPLFQNSITVITSKLIEETYENCLKNNNFL